MSNTSGIQIDKEKLFLLNTIVKLEEEVERLKKLESKLKSEYSTMNKIEIIVIKYKYDFTSESNFIKFIKENNIMAISHCEEEGIYIEYKRKELDSEFNKRKGELTKRIDKLTLHYIPYNINRLEKYKLKYNEEFGQDSI